MLAVFTHNLDPVLFRLGPLEVRYYGVVFALVLLGGYFLWRWQMHRGGYAYRTADRFLLWGVIATIAGARLGHCFFYNASHYLAHPVEVLYFWRGGLASHGATVGLVLAVAGFALYCRRPVLEFIDRFTFSAALGALGVRLGNFLNSEIVGRPTDVWWAVKFHRFEANPVPRHPSQLYEFAMGLTVLLILLAADRLAGREKRPLGLLTGLFFTLYFAGRFGVEFFKKFHNEQLEQVSTLTTGQYLSIIPFAAGAAVLVWCFVRRRPTDSLRPSPDDPLATERPDEAG